MFLRIGHKFNKQEEDFTFGLGIIVPVGPLILVLTTGMQTLIILAIQNDLVLV